MSLYSISLYLERVPDMFLSTRHKKISIANIVVNKIIHSPLILVWVARMPLLTPCHSLGSTGVKKAWESPTEGCRQESQAAAGSRGPHCCETWAGTKMRASETCCPEMNGVHKQEYGAVSQIWSFMCALVFPKYSKWKTFPLSDNRKTENNFVSGPQIKWSVVLEFIQHRVYYAEDSKRRKTSSLQWS